jgi:ABC-type multidrug transport system fused ATPase/permease subunit
MKSLRKHLKSVLQRVDIDPRYGRYLVRDTGLVVAMFLTTVGNAGMNLLSPWPLKYVIDNVVGGQPHTDAFGSAVAFLAGDNQPAQAVAFGVVMVIFAALSGIFNFLRSYLEHVIRGHATLRLRNDTLAHLQALPMSYHDYARNGELVSRINSDTERVINGILASAVDAVLNTMRFLGVLAVLLYTNWRLSLVPLIFAPILLAVFTLTRRKIKAATRAARNEEGRSIALAQESLLNIKIIKAFVNEKRERERFDILAQARMRAELRADAWGDARSPLINILKSTALAICVYIGITQILDGHLTVGGLVVYIAYLRSFYDPFEKLSSVAGALQKAAISAERLSSIFDREPVDADIGADVPTPAPAVHTPRRGAVRFENVSFAYENRPTLTNVSFAINPGAKLGVVGATGAGKSTLINLMLRFYLPAAGRIFVGERDTSQMTSTELRQHFALVTQDPMLFAASIKDNIAYANPGAGMAAVEAAAKIANAHEFIQELPSGYDTVIGERGVTLSGGQRQRIALARAMLSPASILLLDEPTAALDTVAEREVIDSLARASAGRTTIIITHRLAAVRDSDLILVIDGGSVTEQGTHETLLALRGRYFELWQTQLDFDFGMPPTPVANQAMLAPSNNNTNKHLLPMS